MLILPILSAIALGGGTVFERFVLKKRKVDIKLYQVASFLGIVLALLPFVFFFWYLDQSAFQLKNISIFFAVVVFAVIANLLDFYSLKGEKIVNLESVRVLEPLFTIILAILFSLFIEGVYQRNIHVILPALIAALAFVFSHLKKDHLYFNKYFIAGIFGSFFFALELVMSMLILNFYSPFTFYFMRCIFVFSISLIFFSPNFGKLNGKVKWEIFATSAIWVVYRIALYYGYIKIGIISTTLVIMLGPVFVYLFAYLFLKEKVTWKNLVAAVVVIASVVYATVG